MTNAPRCDFCKPHADPKKQRLCHEGTRLFNEMRDASVAYINLHGMREPPVGSVAMAKDARQKAREAFHNHTQGA